MTATVKSTTLQMCTLEPTDDRPASGILVVVYQVNTPKSTVHRPISEGEMTHDR